MQGPLTVALSDDAIRKIAEATRLTPQELDALAELVAAKLQAPPDAMTPKAFARRIGRSPSWVYGEIRAKRLNATRPNGGDMLIAAEDAAAYIAGGKP